MKAFTLNADGSRTPLPHKKISRALEEGAVVVAPGAFDVLGFQQQTMGALFAVAEQYAGREKALRLQASGVEKIHEVMTGAETFRIWAELRKLIEPSFPLVSREIGRKLLRWPDPFYINLNMLLRFMTPHRVLQENYADFSQHLGKLDLHGPHHDYWQNVAFNAVNIWIAVGPVREENGMCIYTEHWGKTLPRGDSHVADGQRTGRPVRVVCDPGDILLFHSHHLHASVLNRSEETRLVITSRLTRSAPAFPDMSRPLPYLLSNKIDAGDMRQAYFDPTGRPQAPPPEMTEAAPSAPARIDDLAEGEIMAVDRSLCVARIDGALRAFGRRCPHQGADLACGHVQDGMIRCPWHDYPFDPATGAGEAGVLRPIRTYTMDEARARAEKAADAPERDIVTVADVAAATKPALAASQPPAARRRPKAVSPIDAAAPIATFPG